MKTSRRDLLTVWGTTAAAGMAAGGPWEDVLAQAGQANPAAAVADRASAIRLRIDSRPHFSWMNWHIQDDWA